MKSKFASFIMDLILLVIILVLSIFGILIYKEITGKNEVAEVENFVSTGENLSDKGEKEKKFSSSQIIDNGLSEIPDTPTKFESNIGKEKQYKSYKFFYNQLNKYSKIIYEILEKNKEQMKTGTATIQFGEKLSELLKQENGFELLQKYYQSAIEAYLADNPDVFYIKPNKLYLNVETTTKWNRTTYNVYLNSGNNLNYLTDDFNSEVEVKNAIIAVEKVRENIKFKSVGKPYHDIKMVHDYLVDNVKYDGMISQNNIYDIYGTLSNGVAVCEGYAKAFKYLLDGLDIPCVVVIGKGTNSNNKTENHAWNYVQVEQNWYGVDVTWDDPIIIGNANLLNEYKYRYFLKGSLSLQKDHLPLGNFTDGGMQYSYPQLSLNDYK